MDPISIALMAGTALSSIFGASKQASAAKSAAQQQADAATQDRQLQAQIYNQNRADNAPRMAAGDAAIGALSSRFGLTQPSGVGMTGPAAAYAPPSLVGMPAGQDPATTAYLQANPDLAAEWARIGGQDKRFQSADQYVAWHKASYPGEQRSDGAPQVQNVGTGDTATPDYASAYGGGAPSAPTYAYDPTVANTGGYGVQARPDVAPLDVSASAYQASPGYDYRVSQGLKAVNHGLSGAGKLMSGQRLTALQDRGDNLANQDYADWRGYTTGQYNADRARTDANYASDRGYTAGRYDTNTAGLQSIAGLGQQAQNSDQSAASAYAGAYGSALTAGAQANAAGSINSANAWSNGLNNIGTTAAYLYGQGAFGSKAPTGYASSSTFAPRPTDAYSGMY